MDNVKLKDNHPTGALKLHSGWKRPTKKIKVKDYKLADKSIKKENKLQKFYDANIYNTIHKNIVLSTLSKVKNYKFKNIYTGFYKFKSFVPVSGKINPIEKISIKFPLNENSDNWILPGIKTIGNIDGALYDIKSKSNNFEMDYFKLGIIFYLSGDDVCDFLID
jgi:hypothetical protein